MIIILSGRETWRSSAVRILLDLLVGFTNTKLISSHKRFFDHARMEPQKLMMCCVDGVRRAFMNFNERCTVIGMLLLLHKQQSIHLPLWVS
jgi:hypothetical protein